MPIDSNGEFVRSVASRPVPVVRTVQAAPASASCLRTVFLLLLVIGAGVIGYFALVHPSVSNTDARYYPPTPAIESRFVAPPTDTPEIVVPSMPPLRNWITTLEDTDFTGGYRRRDGVYHGVTATWVYGQGIDKSRQYSRMQAGFRLEASPIDDASVTIRGLDSEDRPGGHVGKTEILIAVNDRTVYEGPNPLPDDFISGVNDPGNWGTFTWNIGPGILQQGYNVLSITNLELGGTFSQPPFFMLDWTSIEWTSR